MAKKVEVEKIAMEYIAACREEKEAQEKKAALSAVLFTLVPRGEAAFGLKHCYEATKSVSWKGATERILKELVPATKKALAEEIIAGSTTESTREYFRRMVE
jgi:hypothetical protein